MKNLIISILVAFSANTAISQPFSVRVENSVSNDSEFKISFVTTETNSSMCGLTVISLKLKPAVNVNYRDGFAQGRISAEAVALPSSPCLMATGPHRGSMTFTRGHSLPSILNGRYELVINGDNYGFIIVKDSEVFIQSLDEVIN